MKYLLILILLNLSGCAAALRGVGGAMETTGQAGMGIEQSHSTNCFTNNVGDGMSYTTCN